MNGMKIQRLFGVAALGLATVLTGCRAEDVAIIGGAVAIIAGVEAKADRHAEERNRHRPPVVVVPGPRPYPRPCTTYRDSYGRIRSTCPNGYSSAASASSADDRFAALVDIAKKGDLVALESLGVTAQVIRAALKQDREQLNSRVGTLARTLDLTKEATTEFVLELARELKLQGENLTSPLWQACLDKREWRTNANGGVCKSLDWDGCSPDTGATVCY